MKVSLGFNVVDGPYGGGNQFAQALAAHLRERGDTVVFDLNDRDIDIIVLTGSQGSGAAYRHRHVAKYLFTPGRRALVVQRINECDERKGTTGVNARLRHANRVADHTVFVSEWLRDLHLRQGMTPRAHSVILNGSDQYTFHSQGHQPWNGQEPLKLVTHHWSNHPMKGFDIYRQLDDMLADSALRRKYAFTYIGNLPQGFRFQHATHVEPLAGDALAAELRAHHVYVTASRNEPGSNHQNEGALCGLPLLYIESGSLREYCSGYGIGFTPETFAEKLAEMRENYEHWAAQMPGFPFDAETTARAYVTLFEAMLAQRDTLRRQRSLVDLLRVLLRRGVG